MSFLSKIFNRGPKPIIAHSKDGNLASLRAQRAGPAVRTSFAVKSKWGYPVGSGIHNVPSAWDWLRSFRKPREDGKDIWHVCDVGSNFVQQMAGGDFVLFGPIENARLAFPACGMADIMIAEAAKDIGTEPVEEHPINNLL